jgi:hypothetical protein
LRDCRFFPIQPLQLNCKQINSYSKLLDEKKQIVLDVSNNIKDSENIVKHFRELKPNTNNVIQL